MALINTLRNKMGKIVVAFVAVAILSFTLNDILGSGNSLLMGDNTVGKIRGEKITINELQSAMDFQEKNFTVFAQRQPNDGDRYMINDRAWLWLITRYGFGPEFDKLGVVVSEDEEWDMLQGNNIDPAIQMFFANPQTGQFDRNMFLEFYRNRDLYDANARFVWDAVYPTLIPSRLRMKYENLLVKSSYASSLEGEMDYHAQTDVAEVEYLYIPFYSISDTTVSAQVTDGMLRDLYTERKERYKVDETRSLKYISFPVVASSEDTLDIQEEIAELKEEFSQVDDDEIFASSNTDGLNPFGKYHYGNLPVQLSERLDELNAGDVLGPFTEGNSYKIFKVSDIYEDTISYARASHILIRWDSDSDEDKQAARDEANRILNEIKGGANFAAMARQYGTDNTAQVGGDLGWFDSETMVEDFEEPIFAATETGLLPRLVETQFGYHIVEVTGVKTNTVYDVAEIERVITASDRTVNEAYRKADLFQSSVNNEAEFVAEAEAQGIEVIEEEGLGAMDRSVGNLGSSARGVVQWLFRDAKRDMVSDIFDIDDQYVIAVMIGKTDEGYQSLEQVKEDVRVVAIREQKAEYVINKLSGLTGTLQEIAEAYGEDAEVFETSNLKLQSNSVPNIGFDPVAVGKIFSLEQGNTSEAFATDNGVIIARMINKTVAPEVADYSSFSSAISTTRANSASQRINDLIERKADIVDKRYKVY